jgi:hypothetical protein
VLRTRPPGLSQTWSALPGILLFLVAGCMGQKSELRGQPPSGQAISVASLAKAAVDGTVTVRGKMVEK